MKLKKCWNRILAGGMGLALSAGLCLADSKKLARDLPSNADGFVDVIVQFTAAPTAKHHKKIFDKGGALKTDLGGTINGSHYSIPASQLSSVSDDPEVAYISPDRAVQGLLDYANPTVNANLARSGWALTAPL